MTRDDDALVTHYPRLLLEASQGETHTRRRSLFCPETKRISAQHFWFRERRRGLASRLRPARAGAIRGGGGGAIMRRLVIIALLGLLAAARGDRPTEGPEVLPASASASSQTTTPPTGTTATASSSSSETKSSHHAGGEGGRGERERPVDALSVSNHNPAAVLNDIHVRLPQRVRLMTLSSRGVWGRCYYYYF